MPGALPAYASLPAVGATNFQLYNDAATNTTICYIGGMADGNEVKVKINSRVPVNVTGIHLLQVLVQLMNLHYLKQML